MISEYGSREGIAERLTIWADRLSTYKFFPWMGTGIIADLKTAAALLKGLPAAPKTEDFDL